MIEWKELQGMKDAEREARIALNKQKLQAISTTPEMLTRPKKDMAIRKSYEHPTPPEFKAVDPEYVRKLSY